MAKTNITVRSGVLTFDDIPADMHSLVHHCDCVPSAEVIRALELSMQYLLTNVVPFKSGIEPDPADTGLVVMDW